MSLLYILYFLLSPVIFLILILAIPINKKIRDHWLNGRKTLKKVINKDLKNPLIFHAASAGEFEQIKPLLRNRTSKQPIIQTFFSPTIYNKAKDCDLFDVCCYHPFDFPWSAYFFFKKLKPKKYIINRHDIWPHHIFIAKILKIQIIYINANLKSDSFRLKKIFKGFSGWLFKKMNIIIVPSNEIKNRFIKNFKIDDIAVLQDTRFMQINHRVQQKREIKLVGLSPKPTIILGSIDNNDWKIIYQSIKKNQSLNFNMIIVPHEIDDSFINKIYQDIKELNLSAKRFTDKGNAENLDFIIYDKMGDLLDIYKYGKLAYVGCGFSDGVHNILEPAMQGSYVGYGPNITLLDEAIKLHSNNLGKMIYTSEDFTDFIKTMDDIFLNDNKNKVLNLFKVDLKQFESMKNIIYEA